MQNTPTAPRLVVFAYAFPHKKTQDVLLRLTALGRPPTAVLAAPWQPLPVAPPAVRVKPRHADLLHPADLCRSFGIEYHVVDHRSESCLLLLDWLKPELGVIGGARILSGAVLDYFRHGVVNLHPGVLPDVRGLDALQWSLYDGLPLGVTAHIVDARVDAGWILEKRLIDIYQDDTLVDLGLRLYETQLAMLGPALAAAATSDRSALEMVEGVPLRPPFPPDFAGALPLRLEQLRERARDGRMPTRLEVRA
jgi:folate-dependent phosphoribosylglycinamide formyltransferase PurN